MVRGTARSLAAALTLRSTVVRGLAYEAQLHRIAAREPEVKAFTEPAGDIVARVERCDAGLLVAVKDNIACDGLPPARCGSELPPEAHAINAGPEATVVTRLREAGCVIAGTTRLAEFAALAPPATTNPLAGLLAGRLVVGLGGGRRGLRRRGARDADAGSIGRPAALVASRPSRRRGARAARRRRACSPSIDVIGAFARDCPTRGTCRAHLRRREEPDPDGGLPPKLVVLETFRDAVCATEAKVLPRLSRACGTPASRARCARCPRRCWTTSRARAAAPLLGECGA